MQTWFITSTTYGTWLPGNERGFVSNVLDERFEWVRHNAPNTPYDADDPDRRQFAKSLLRSSPIHFTVEHAEAIAAQFHETVCYRHWRLHSFAIMASHVHVVVSADDAVESSEILGALKSYASRRLNQRWPRPVSGTWWTESGSQRPVDDEAYFVNVVRYVADQPGKLAFWIDPALMYLLDSSERGTLVP